MGKDDGHRKFVGKLGIKEPKVDANLLDRPTRPPLPHQALVERTTFREERRLPLEEPVLRRPSTPSIAPQVAQEAKETYERLHQRIANWETQELREGREDALLTIQKLGQRRPGAHLQGRRNLNILIMESVSFYLDAIQLAIEQSVPNFFPDTTKSSVQTVNCFNSGVFKVQISPTPFDLVFLAHRLHLTPANCTEADPEFHKSLEPIGYSLMEIIRSEFSDTVVIGTAIPTELDGSEMQPDFVMKKRWGEATKSLRQIMDEIHRTSKLG